MTRLIGIFLICWLVMLGGCLAVASSPFVRTIGQIKRSVVPIVCASQKGGVTWEVTSIEGTGFFVSGDGRFATANHVLEGMERSDRQKPCKLPSLYFPRGGWSLEKPSLDIDIFRFILSSCVRAKETDLAICNTIDQIKSKGYETVPVVLELGVQLDGTAIAFTGFPLSSVLPLTSIGTISGYLDIRDERGPRDIIIDKAAWPGASGSPMYLENGRVVGILVQRGINAGIGRAVGRPSRFIQDLLTAKKEENKPAEK